MTRGRELDALRREGKRVRTEHLDVRVLASLPAFGEPDAAASGARVGIIVPQHKPTGVERTQLKRRLRELARLRLLPALPAGAAPGGAAPGCAVLLRARPEAYAARFDALARDVERAAREAARWVAAQPPVIPAQAGTPNAGPAGTTPA